MVGRFAGHRFAALLFPEHADDPAWEIGRSRISKLWVRRLADRATVFNWDRGEDVPAADPAARRAAAVPAADPAGLVYPEAPPADDRVSRPRSARRPPRPRPAPGR